MALSEPGQQLIIARSTPEDLLLGGSLQELRAGLGYVGGLPTDALPPARLVEHLHHVRQQHMIMRAKVPRTRGGVPGDGVDQAGGGAHHRGAATPAATRFRDRLEIGKGRVTLGVHDRRHVLGPADHPELGHRFVRGNDQLHPRPTGTHQPFPRHRMTGPTRPEDRLVLDRGDGPGQGPRRAAPSPPHTSGLSPLEA